MYRISKQVVRIALLIMLFQVLCPAFIQVVVPQTRASKTTTFSIRHTSVVAPMFLKEKEEKENSEEFSVSDSAPLLDLSRHSFNLTASHACARPIFSERSFTQSPLSELLCTLLI